MKEKLKNFLSEVGKIGFMACGSPPDISASMAKETIEVLDDLFVVRRKKKIINEIVDENVIINDDGKEK